MGDWPAHTATRGVLQGGMLSATLFIVSLINLSKVLPKWVGMFFLCWRFFVLTSCISQRYGSPKLEEEAKTILDHLKKRDFTASPGESATTAFTRWQITKYQIFIMETLVAFVKQHVIFGVTLCRALTWSHPVRRVKGSCKYSLKRWNLWE